MDELDDWPEQKVMDFVEIMNVEAQVQKQQDKQGSGGGGTQSDAQVEAAYQALKQNQAQ